MKDAYWFRHDANARHDDKCYALMKKYGMAGYGMYWVIIERLREATDYKLSEDPITLNGLAAEFDMDVEKVKTFIDDLITVFGLLRRDEGGFVSSARLLRDMALKETLSSKNSQNAKTRWQKERERRQQEEQRKPGELYFVDMKNGERFFIAGEEWEKLNETQAQHIETRKVTIFKNKMIKVSR